MGRLTKLLRCQRGASAIQYVLVASLIAIAAIYGFHSVGNHLVITYDNVSNNL